MANGDWLSLRTARHTMIDPELLEILCCPETHQGLTLASAQVVEVLNRSIEAGNASNRGGKRVTDRIDGALVRQDGKYAYPIRQKIPVMLMDEALPLSS